MHQASRLLLMYHLTIMLRGVPLMTGTNPNHYQMCGAIAPKSQSASLDATCPCTVQVSRLAFNLTNVGIKSHACSQSCHHTAMAQSKPVSIEYQLPRLLTPSLIGQLKACASGRDDGVHSSSCTGASTHTPAKSLAHGYSETTASTSQATGRHHRPHHLPW